MPRFAEAVAAVAVTALGLAVSGAASTPSGTPVAPPAAAEAAALAKRPTYTAFASQRVYFVMPDR